MNGAWQWSRGTLEPSREGWQGKTLASVLPPPDSRRWACWIRHPYWHHCWTETATPTVVWVPAVAYQGGQETSRTNLTRVGAVPWLPWAPQLEWWKQGEPVGVDHWRQINLEPQTMVGFAGASPEEYQPWNCPGQRLPQRTQRHARTKGVEAKVWLSKAVWPERTIVI
jgi:hypothetical protein